MSNSSPAVCTPTNPNGTLGRVYTQELRANNQTPAQRAKSEAAFKRALMCNNGVTGAIACNQPFLEVTNVSAEVSAGGMSTGVEVSGSGARTTYMAGAKGVSSGTEGYQYEVGGSDLPKAKAGLCVALKGSKAPDHSVKAEVSGGVGGVSYNGHEFCVFAQTPSVPAGSVTVK